jgi:hypothetical protein
MNIRKEPAKATTPESFVDALNSAFGKQTTQRAAHAKGVVLLGKFVPSAEAASVSNALADISCRRTRAQRPRPTISKTRFASALPVERFDSRWCCSSQRRATRRLLEAWDSACTSTRHEARL